LPAVAGAHIGRAAVEFESSRPAAAVGECWSFAVEEAWGSLVAGGSAGSVSQEGQCRYPPAWGPGIWPPASGVSMSHPNPGSYRQHRQW
jgi:hypothetical protein